MRTSFLIFCFSLLSTALLAQLGCPEKYTMRVIANSGLNMRSQPSLKSSVVVTVPYKAELTSCASTSGRITVSGITGYWRKSVYKGQVGYMFDGFLEIVKIPETKQEKEKTETAEKKPTEKEKKPVKREEPAKEPPKEKPKEGAKTNARQFQFLTETYNFCGNVEKINPGLLWYGFYPPGENENQLKVQRVEVEVVLSKARSSDQLEFDIQTDLNERSIFLIGTNRPLDLTKVDTEDRSDLLRYSNRKVFPGQEINLSSDQNSFSLGATGGIKTSGDCPELDNYKLMLKGESEQELTSLLPSGQCGLPEIYWFGDFSGDGIPEIIFVSVYEDRNSFSLLVSEGTGQGQMLRKEAEWTIKKCK